MFMYPKVAIIRIRDNQAVHWFELPCKKCLVRGQRGKGVKGVGFCINIKSYGVFISNENITA